MEPDDNPETTESALFRYNDFLKSIAANNVADNYEPPPPQTQFIKANNFRVLFTNFGNLDADNGFGRFVNSISLPTLSFSTRRIMSNVAAKSVLTADEARWAPVSMVLTDDVENQMMSQVMIQCQKQRYTPAASHFILILDLLHMGNTIRRYTHTGCTILYAAHDRELDYSDPMVIPYRVQIQVDNIEVISSD
jgi:hypothetical protein